MYLALQDTRNAGRPWRGQVDAMIMPPPWTGFVLLWIADEARRFVKRNHKYGQLVLLYARVSLICMWGQSMREALAAFVKQLEADFEIKTE